MANRIKETAEYFPFFVKDGKTLFVLQRKYGLSGIGFFTQIMRMLSQSPAHYYVYGDEYEKDRLNVYVGMCENDVRAYLADMVKTGKINEELWKDRDVIYSEDFALSLSELYRRRQKSPPSFEDVLAMTVSCRQYVGNMPHRVKKSRVEKSRVEKSRDNMSGKPDVTSQNIKTIIDYLNEKLGTKYTYAGAKQHRAIVARLNEGFTVDDFLQVIDTKYDDWIDDEKMKPYLRPETLFGTKFESYLQGSAHQQTDVDEGAFDFARRVANASQR